MDVVAVEPSPSFVILGSIPGNEKGSASHPAEPLQLYHLTGLKQPEGR